MPETVMICIDNSEYMRNGDYGPTRMSAIQEAATTVFNVKIQSNPENTVGLMTIGGRNPELLVSPTDDQGKVLRSIREVRLYGRLSFCDGVQVAYLALKHRRNLTGQQRIVVFVGSPVEDESKALKKVAGNLRKNNIAIDVISLGEADDNRAKLEEFVQAADKDGNSKLVEVPVGCIPSDVLMSSPVLGGGDGGGDSQAPAPADDFGGFGVDPNIDPELAMALRISMEEQRRADGVAPGAAPGVVEATAGAAPVVAPGFSVGQMQPMDQGGEDDEEEMLRQALALSLDPVAPAPTPAEVPAPAPVPAPVSSASSMVENDETGDDDDLQLALQMSMQQDEPPATSPEGSAPIAAAPSSTPAVAPTPPPSAPIVDPAFVTSLLANLPGVDPNDPRIQEALRQMQEKKDAPKKD